MSNRLELGLFIDGKTYAGSYANSIARGWYNEEFKVGYGKIQPCPFNGNLISEASITKCRSSDDTHKIIYRAELLVVEMCPIKDVDHDRLSKEYTFCPYCAKGLK